MDDSEAVSLEQIRGFLVGSGEVRFTGLKRAEVYNWVERTLVRHQYASLGRADKGVVRQYVGRMTGLRRAQVTRLIAGQRKTGRVVTGHTVFPRPAHGSSQRDLSNWPASECIVT